MPALDEDNPGVAAVAAFESLLKELLDQAATAKSTTEIEPALSKSDFTDIAQSVSTLVSQLSGSEEANEVDGSETKSRQYAIIETAARNIFSQLIATTPISSPDFVNIWNLLDILSILSDDGQCDPALLFWLSEELLDSQDISGCRKVFDFLESRRERITAKHFKQKQLIILRSCNELLRRLSRAEDTAFCGRVFIFMFQSFPLGDKSSVNLRGEFHVENVTTYEVTSPESGSKMDVDAEADSNKEQVDQNSAAGKNGLPEAKKPDKPLSPDALYPLFWSLQDSFSQPKKLFDAVQFTSFRNSLEATVKAFQTIRNDQGPRTSKSAEDAKSKLKRKRDDGDDDSSANAFNPKYLTSRDLFELEISDLSFRRHVLVQALIIMDFLISLSAQARERLASVNALNKSVMYMDQIMSEDDTKWANEMKKTIAEYLKSGSDGPYFFRMVETVLSRDKNWVRWKIEGCPIIKRDPVSPASFIEAKTTTQRNATSKRLRPVPMGAVSLDFLRTEDEEGGMGKLKAEERYQLPELDTFERKIADDDFEIDMPTNNQTKAAAVAGKASKSWRALRIASRNKLAAFDKIDEPKNVAIVFEELVEVDEEEEDVEPTASEEDMPSNREPIIISGPSCVGKTTLIEKLMELHKGVFATVVGHTTREPEEGEVNGKTLHFVKAQEFNQLRDGDRLVAHSTRDGVDYGVSFKSIEAVTETGKIPIIELDLETAQYAKDMDFEARYILVKPPTPEALADRLRKRSQPDADFQKVLEGLSSALDESKTSEVFSVTILDDDLDSAATILSNALFEKDAAPEKATEELPDVDDQNGSKENGGEAGVSEDVEMENKEDVQAEDEGENDAPAPG